MKKLPGEHTNDQPDDVTVELRAALNAQQLQEYLAVDGPLRISDLPPEIATSEAFEHFVGQYDWPSYANAGSIAPTREAMYEDANDFWYHMYDGDGPKYLNNFKDWLATPPIDDRRDAKTMTAIAYGLQPALARAHIVAEPLFQVLRTVASQSEGIPINATQAAHVAERYSDVPQAALAAYRLLGKLLTQDDQKMVIKKLDANPDEVGVITDAHEYLWK